MISKNTLKCNFICYFACWLGVKADRSVEGKKEHVVCVLWVRVTHNRVPVCAHCNADCVFLGTEC